MAGFPIVRASIEMSYADLPASMGKPCSARAGFCVDQSSSGVLSTTSHKEASGLPNARSAISCSP
jgi:hypothetical protein